ncbi:diacylglycerol kinase family protein [Bacillus massiliglaciei]|uniref:diacylglycerol kinase family protein n=1 Tax=Bacillus massiliglaciei TaxID=1816693 RepID=UPI000B188F75|nr:diacylglycerol kinase family protein [Bacillus massiliglaciei]
MGFRENRDKRYPLVKSFGFAFAGIFEAVRTERNIRIHLVMLAAVAACGVYFEASRLEWLFILTAAAGTIALELVNSALERVVDLVTADYHPLAKQAKDIAAGAVLIYAIFSIIIGLIIFVPKIGI